MTANTALNLVNRAGQFTGNALVKAGVSRRTVNNIADVADSVGAVTRRSNEIEDLNNRTANAERYVNLAKEQHKKGSAERNLKRSGISVDKGYGKKQVDDITKKMKKNKGVGRSLFASSYRQGLKVDTASIKKSQDRNRSVWGYLTDFTGLNRAQSKKDETTAIDDHTRYADDRLNEYDEEISKLMALYGVS